MDYCPDYKQSFSWLARAAIMVEYVHVICNLCRMALERSQNDLKKKGFDNLYKISKKFIVNNKNYYTKT